MRVVFAGGGEFGLPTLTAIAGAHELVAVYTQPDRPAGRGRQMTPTRIGAWAAARGVAVVKTADFNAEAMPGCDVLVVIAFGQKLSAEVVGRPRFGAINLHASRLPKYRGAAPIHRAVMAGETETGNSVIRLAEKMDAGAVLGMSRVAIGATETTGEVHDRLAADGVGLVLGVLAALEAGTAVEVEQDHSAATVARKLSRETAVVDWGKPAVEVANQIRGLWPWPGCRVEVGGLRASLARARAVEVEGALGVIDEAGRVGCGVGSVEVLEIQVEGGRAMGMDAFLRGRAAAWMPGTTIRGIA